MAHNTCGRCGGSGTTLEIGRDGQVKSVTCSSCGGRGWQ